MTIDDKTRTELEAAVFRRLVEHLRARTDVQNIDLMNLAGFCRNCLSNWMKEEADAKGVAVSKDESREAVYGMPYEDLEGETSGHRHAGAARGDEEGPSRALSLAPSGLVLPCISCGRAVDERDVALTQAPPILRVILQKAPCGNACGA